MPLSTPVFVPIEQNAPAPSGPGAWLRASGKRPARTRVVFWAAAATIIALALIALLAPHVAPYSPTDQLDIVGLKSQAPSHAHPFGTDRYSRDVLSRVIFGARISLSVGGLAVLLAATVGTTYGVVSGYVGGRVDAVLMRLLDAFLSIPRVLLLVAVLSLWTPVPLGMLIVIIGLTSWFEVSRLVRIEVRSVRERDFVTAARALGTSDVRIIVRHVLPH